MCENLLCQVELFGSRRFVTSMLCQTVAALRGAAGVATASPRLVSLRFSFSISKVYSRFRCLRVVKIPTRTRLKNEETYDLASSDMLLPHKGLRNLRLDSSSMRSQNQKPRKPMPIVVYVF